MKIKLLLFVLLIFLFSCSTFNNLNEVDLKNYKWVFITTKLIEDDEIKVIWFIYEKITFVDFESLLLYHLRGYLTMQGELAYLEENELYLLDYKIKNDELTIFLQDGNKELKICENGDFFLKDDVIFKRSLIDADDLPMLEDKNDNKQS